PHVPADMADFVQRLLIKDREKRPSMTDVVRELGVLAEQYPLPRSMESARHAVLPSLDPLRTTGAEPAQSKKSTLGASASQVGMRTTRRWRVAALALGLLLFLAGGLTIYVVRGAAKGDVVLGRLRQAANLVAHATDPETTTPPVK